MSNLVGKLTAVYEQYRSLIYLCIVTIVAELAYSVMNQSALPPYLEIIGLKAQAGIVIGTFLVVEALFKSPMGFLGDRIGRRPLIVCGALVSVVTAVTMTVVSSFWPIICLRVFDGLAAAAIWPTVITSISGSVESNKRALAMNAMNVMYMSGIALGPLLGGLTNDLTGSRKASFYLVSALFLLTAVVAYFLTPHRSMEEEKLCHNEQSKITLRDVLVGIRSIPDMMLLAFISFFAVGLLIPIVKYFAMDEFHLSETGFGTMVLPVAGAIAVASLFAGRLGDVWGKARSVRLGIGLSAAGMWFVTASKNVPELILASVFIGSGFILAMPSFLAFVADICHPGQRGSVMGALGSAQGVGAVVGAVLGSHLYEKVSIHFLGVRLVSHYTPFAVSAIALSVAFILVVLLVKDTDERRIGPARVEG